MHRVDRIVRTAFGVLVLSIVAAWSGILATETITIARLLGDPQAYHMKVVTLQGTSHQVMPLRDAPSTLPRLDFQCYFVHPPYTFVLADDTGFLQITVRGRPPCVAKESPAQPPDVAEGTKVRVDVQITVTEQHAGAAMSPVQALAVGIHRLED